MRYAKTVTNSNSQFYIDTKRYVYDSLNIEDELFFCFWLNQMQVIDDIFYYSSNMLYLVSANLSETTLQRRIHIW